MINILIAITSNGTPELPFNHKHEPGFNFKFNKIIATKWTTWSIIY